MAAADHDDVLACQFGGLLAARRAVIKQSGFDGGLFAEGGQSLRARRARCPPGARGVDHSLGLKPFFSVVGAADVDDERLLRAAGVDREVAALAAHAYDAGAVANTVAQRLGQRGQVFLDPLSAGRVAGLGRAPTGRLEQPARRWVDELGPRREQADVAPLGYRRCRTVARLQDHGLQASLEQMSSSGQALRTGPDNDDGIHFNLHVLMFFDGSSLPHISTDVNA